MNEEGREEKKVLLTLQDFAEIRAARSGRKIVRCSCGDAECRGWSEVDTVSPWGLRDYEADPEFIGPLLTG